MQVFNTIKIHPAIGIARLGNSPTKFFVGPEVPGVRPVPIGGYKDGGYRIKRQAARFRLFGYDQNNVAVKEITSADAKISWTVHLANKKAEWVQFQGPKANTDPNKKRNAGISNRRGLIIDPGPRSLTAPNKVATFNTGKFLGSVVPLGEMHTDAQGHLLVLGGFGKSDSPTNSPITHWANNDGWHDDVSDGPVTAKVTLHGTKKQVQAVPAWVICAPPKFAPPIDNVITMYDVLFRKAAEKGWLAEPVQPSFTNDVYPILQRAINMKWVSAMAAPHHFTFSSVIPPPGTQAARQAIFDRLRDPNIPLDEPSTGDMPMMWSDIYDTTNKYSEPLTKTQYNILSKWKDGNFVNDWAGPPTPVTQITPAGLDRASLETCVGGALYPGIEASWMFRDVYPNLEPFRLDQTTLRPGDVTKQMAVPWQADFFDCQVEDPLVWWPAQRPDDVFPTIAGPQVQWTRKLVNNNVDMIKKWHRLGFVVKEGSAYVEVERK